MKTTTKILIITLISILSIYISKAEKTYPRTAIILQENSGKTPLDSAITDPAALAISRTVVDALAETFETATTTLQGIGKYSRVVNLTDNNCTRAKLLAELITQSKQGYDIDLFIYGHGGNDLICLKGDNLLGGESGNLRKLLVDARNQENNQSFKFKLRLVYSCTCIGSSLNDDWLAIGATTAVGSRFLNYMAEPMITFFLNDFLNNGKTVFDAASSSFNGAKTIWSVFPWWQQTNDAKCDNTTNPAACKRLSRIDESQPMVAGNVNLIFKDQLQLDINETRNFTVYANVTHNFSNIFICNGERYTFTTPANAKWKNNITETGMNGYTPNPVFDAGRRQTSYNMMALIGEMFRKNNDVSTYDNKHFKIGTSANYSPTSNGFLVCHANDNLVAYGDNNGSVTVTVRRTR
ncbi:MAG: hypothetical protein IPP08_11560 [Chlorobiota bacterium]|nr:hypothetical protein [Chlorobiota bacterium]QQS66382.1 MAG: hypothetical protein IPP08_11560 [Chlorobiota bacterium]